VRASSVLVSLRHCSDVEGLSSRARRWRWRCRNRAHSLLSILGRCGSSLGWSPSCCDLVIYTKVLILRKFSTVSLSLELLASSQSKVLFVGALGILSLVVVAAAVAVVLLLSEAERCCVHSFLSTRRIVVHTNSAPSAASPLLFLPCAMTQDSEPNK